MNKVKSSAIPFTGYIYQTYHGMSWLLDWLASPTRFVKMQFECNDKSLAPQGLDDIVAWRADGRLDYAQVKFTPNPDDYKLSWDWLLELPSTKNPKSLIMKWRNAMNAIAPANLGRVRLITNREPDEEFGRCLDGDRINFDKLSPERRLALVAQLGDEPAARQIFDVLEIEHSNTAYLVLESEILGQLVQLGYDEGSFQRLFSESTKWATHENLPAPEGFITLDAVRAVLSTLRPEPISQEFEVPVGYIPPDADFHRELLKTISKANDRNNLHVLSGPPGRGKSTYLSYLTATLDMTAVPVIRHHYFLSTMDRSTDRMRLHAVANSLLSQIARLKASGEASTSHESLRGEITSCAEEFKARGVPLVIIVDGLDHVWRQGKDVRPLNELFQQLIPVPPNTHLILGTQPVGDDQLPDRLIVGLERDSWREVPPMSPQSILAYVVSLVRSRRWIRPTRNNFKDEILACSAALHDRTGGHPLHLIFSVEELLKTDNSPTEYRIKALPPCPDNDIRKYYKELWLKLTSAQQDSLHLICELQFYWPEHAFSSITTAQHPVSVEGITHLLFESTVGFRPFHESLTVFVRSNQYHTARVDNLLPMVETWLSTSAPAVIRNSWLYSLRAKRGDHAQLAQVLTRKWVLERLVDGYPTATIERMLQEAEQYVFDAGDYPEAYRLRALKHRVSQGPKFQIYDMQTLQAMCWAVSNDQSLVNETIANVASLSPIKQGSLSRALSFKRDSRAKSLARRAFNRFQAEYRFKHGLHDSQSEHEFHYLIERLAESGALRTEYFTERGVLDDEPRDMVVPVLRGLVQRGDISTLFLFHEHTSVQSTTELIEMAIFAVSVENKIDLTAWGEAQRFWASDVANLYLALKTRNSDGSFNRNILPLVPVLWRNERQSDSTFGPYLIYCFFNSLALNLLPADSLCLLSTRMSQHKMEQRSFLAAIENAAATAALLLKSQQPLGYEFIFEATKHIPVLSGGSYQNMEEYQSIKRSLHTIALRLHLFSMAFGAAELISPASIERARSCKHFASGRFMADAVELHVQMLSPELLHEVVQKELSQLSTAREQIGTTIETLLELAQLCAIQRDINAVRRLCHNIWTLVLGYGNHKDTAVLEVLEAIKHLASHDAKAASDILVALSGVIEKVADFTDGDETNNVHRWAADALQVASPAMLVKKYRYHLSRGEWSAAQDTIQSGLKNLEPSSRFAQALARTGLRSGEMPRSWRDGDESDGGNELYEISQRFLGIELTVDKSTESTPFEHKKFDADFSSYDPSQLHKLFADIREAGHFYERDYLTEWYDYWKQKSHSKLVQSLHNYLFEGKGYDGDVRYILDQLFDSTVSLFGRDKGFAVAVLAQVENRAWSNWPISESREASMERLRKVATLYPERANEFIVQSCTTPDTLFRDFTGESYTIPSTRLVYFLVEVGDTERARLYLTQMVSTLLDETRTFTLPRPAWANTQPEIDVAALSLYLLIARLKSGVSTTRWWAIQEIADLLVDVKTQVITERALLEHLDDIRIDTELLEVLALFAIAVERGYDFSTPVQVSNVGSCLAVRLCELLDIRYTRCALLAAPEGFSAAQKYFEVEGLPGMLINDLQRLQSASDFPWMSQANFEAARLSETVYYSRSVEFFFGPIRGPRFGALLSNATQIARSAYLRTLYVANQAGGMPEQSALDWSQAAVPHIPLLMGMRPHVPEYWSVLCKASRGDAYDPCALASIVLKLSNDVDRVIGALNAPIWVSETELWTIQLVLFAHQPQMDADELIYELAPEEELREFLVLGLFSDEGTYRCTNSYKTTKNKRTRSVALPFLVIPHGYLHLEVLSRGIYLPVPADVEEECWVAPNEYGISVHSADKTIGHYSYWNTEWSATYPKMSGPGCATSLMLQRDALSLLKHETEVLAYRCSITKYRRGSGYGEFDDGQVEHVILKLD